MISYLKIEQHLWPKYQEDIMALEAIAFSAAQCHPAIFYLNILKNPRQVSFVALVNGKIAGFLFSGPLELFPDTPGVKEDPYFGKSTVLYGADMVVNPEYRGQGIGKGLKQQQLIGAKNLGYKVVAGRNRVKYAHTMWCINQSFGAQEIQRLTGIYKDGLEPNECIYQHIVL